MTCFDMKRPLVFYPFLFAIYPIFGLYARLPGGLLPVTLIRPMVIAVLGTGILLFITGRLLRSLHRGAFITFLFILFFSTSGHIYRLVTSYYLPGAPPTTHLIIVIIELILLGLLCLPHIWRSILKLERLKTVTNYLNIVSVIVLVWPMIQIGKVWLPMLDDAPKPWSDLIQQGDVRQHLTYEGQPDIYYLVLDGYGRQDMLQEVYNFDNSEFIGFLRDSGFTIADQSRSNYVQTVLSLSSSLNMGLLDFTEQYAGPDSTNMLPLMKLIQHSRVMNMLSDVGYSIVAFSSDFPYTEWTDADVYIDPYSSKISELERFILSTTALGLPFDLDWQRNSIWLSSLPLPSYETRQIRVTYAFDGLKSVAALDGPKFVFAHIIVPHPPFVFNAEGNAIVPNVPYSPADGEAFQGTPVDYQQAYIKQLQFANREMRVIVDAILTQSKKPPIIIIQGDHGPGSLLKRDDLNRSCLWERTSILNAYYFPGNADKLYPTITPVNSFRVLFNGYFGTDFPLLPDKTYFSPISWPYNFTDITDRIEPTCKISE
jgi:hypothetical protein